MSNLRLVGAVAIKVRPDTTDFRKETQREINEKLGTNGERAKAKAKVEVNLDADKAKREFRTLQEEMDGKSFKLNVGLDHDSVRRARQQIDRAMDSLKNPVMDVHMNPASLARVRKDLNDLQDKVRVKMEFDQDEAGYRKVLAKIDRIRRENAKEVDVPISFHTDEASLRKEELKAKEALKRIEANKTVDIRYSDNYDGMKKAIGELDDRLEDIRKLKITTKLDEHSLEEARADLVDMMQYADVTVRFNEDKAGYEKVLSRIREIQREKLEKDITFSTDDESLREQAAHYEQLIKDANERAAIASKFEPVTIDYNEDLAGYTAALEHIKKLQREKLVKKLTFNTDEKSLAEEAKKLQQRVDNLTPPRKIEITYNNDRSSLMNALHQVESEISKNWDITVPVNADTHTLLATRAKIQALLEAAPVEMKIHPDEAGYQSVLKKIADIRREKVQKEISFTTDDADLDKTEKEIKAKLAARIQEVAVKFRTAMNEKDLEEAKHQAEQLKDHIDHMKASMKVELAGSELTSARLRFLGRDRVVNYIAKVNERSMAVAEGLLKSIGGLNTFGSIGSTLEGIFTKFDNYSLKATALATALGSVANVGVYMGTAVFKVGEGVVQSLGLLAAAPAILGAATAGYTIFTAAFNNFFDAFNKDPKIAASSLAALPPLARKTVDSITGLYKGLANPIQERFWSRVGTTLSDAIDKLYPNLKKRLLESTDAVGDFVAGFGKSMTKLSISGDLDKMFEGFKGFFVNLSKASEPFFDAWNRFGVQGSSLLPMFGQWIADNAKRFDDWSKALGKDGITDMIMHGVHSLQEMWKVGGDVADIFKAITRAAGLAGTGGLAQFQVNLRKTADTMLAEPWQSKAANIFKGARDGAHELNGGFKDLTGTLGNASQWLGTVLTQLGDIGGNVLTGFSDLFGSQKYQGGITAELRGVQDLTSSLRPSFKAIGDLIGDMGTVAGSVFSEMGPVINQLTTMLSGAVSNIAENLASVAPKFLATIGGVLRVAAPLVDGVTKMLSGLLGLLAKVPNNFVILGVAATTFFALRGLASKFFDTFKQTGTFKNLENQWLTQQTAAGKTVDKYKMVNGELQKFTVPTGKFSATAAGYQAITGGAGKLRDQFRDLNGVMQRMDGTTSLGNKLKNLQTVAMPGVKAAASGLLSFLGGAWGIGFMAAGALIGIFAQKQADAKQHVEALTASIDKQSGKMNAAGLEEIAKKWSDIGKASDGWANFTRGSKAANETAGLLKLNLGEVTRTLAEGGPASDELGTKLQNLASSMDAVESFDPAAGSDALKLLKDRATDAAGAFGFSTDELEAMGLKAADVQHLADNFKDEATQIALSKKMMEGLAEATGSSTGEAQQMAEAMKTIGDNSTDAASKIGAINKALDLLKGGKLSAREAEVKANSDYQTAIQQAKALKEELAGGASLINKTTGLIDTTSSAGLQLQQTMSTAANGIKTAAMAAYQAATDAGAPPAQAMEAAQTVINAHKNDLKGIAEAAGVDVKTIQKEWDGFFGKKWELNAVFSASAIQFEAAKKAVEEAGLEWNDKTFSAFLEANPDPAKLSAEEATAAGKKFANDYYEAKLKAINPDALQKILQATGQAQNYKDGNYTAVMKALNSTNPGVQAALTALLNVKNGDYAAAIKAFLDAVTKSQTEAALNQLARTREANVLVKYSTGPGRQIAAEQGLNGFLSDGKGGYPGGFRPLFPKVTAFANGGISVEKPGPAKIYAPATQFRVFAEASTGGEAFIPMAASKRQRSTQILGEVAKQFGLRLTSAHAFADGGIVTKSRTGGSVAVHIGEYTQNTNDTTDDVARAIMRRVKNEGFYAPMEGF